MISTHCAMLQSSVLKTADIQVWLAFVFRQSNYLSTTDHLVLYSLYYTLATQTFEIVYQMSMQYIYHLPLQSHLRIYQFSLGQITITISIYFTVHYNSCQLLGPL